mgnify:CR=1 FL=1
MHTSPQTDARRWGGVLSRKPFWRFTGAIAFTLFLCGACERAGKTAAAPTNGIIAVSLLTLDNPHFRQIGESIRAEGLACGYDVRVVSGDFDVGKQSEQVKTFIAQKVRAIVLSPCDSVAIGPAIRAANAAGIPVFTADIACLAPDAKVVTHVATDNYGGGKQAAHAMIEALQGKGGKVAIIDHKPIESCTLRVKGFKDILAKHQAGGYAGRIEIVAEQPGGASFTGGERAAQALLSSHPSLDGLFAVNDPSALGAYRVFKKAGRADAIAWVGFDGSPAGMAAVDKGVFHATPIQYPDQIGIETMRVIVRHFKGEALPTEWLIPTSLYRQKDSPKTRNRLNRMHHG